MTSSGASRLATVLLLLFACLHQQGRRNWPSPVIVYLAYFLPPLFEWCDLYGRAFLIQHLAGFRRSSYAILADSSVPHGLTGF